MPVIMSEQDLEQYVGRLVEIRGRVSNAKPPRIISVEVDVPDDLRHKEGEAFAVGILTKYEITEDQYRAARDNGGAIGLATLGPGTYYQLVDNQRGRLAQAREVPDGAHSFGGR